MKNFNDGKKKELLFYFCRKVAMSKAPWSLDFAMTPRSVTMAVIKLAGVTFENKNW
jgi:hypothetical protein